MISAQTVSQLVQAQRAPQPAQSVFSDGVGVGPNRIPRGAPNLDGQICSMQRT